MADVQCVLKQRRYTVGYANYNILTVVADLAENVVQHNTFYITYVCVWEKSFGYIGLYISESAVYPVRVYTVNYVISRWYLTRIILISFNILVYSLIYTSASGPANQIANFVLGAYQLENPFQRRIERLLTLSRISFSVRTSRLRDFATRDSRRREGTTEFKFSYE